MTSANIKTLKYLLMIGLGSTFEIFCMLSPKINDEVPIKNETTVRRFCVTEIAIGVAAVSAVVTLSCCSFTANTDEMHSVLFEIRISSNETGMEFIKKVIIFCAPF